MPTLDSTKRSLLRWPVTPFNKEYDGLFFKYLRKKLGEKASNICGTLVDDFKNKDKVKNVIGVVIKLVYGNSSHLVGKIRKMAEEKLDADSHKKYHEYVCQLYLSEYIKKTCMVKYTEVYGDASAALLDQSFAKDDPVNKVALDVMGSVKTQVREFMDERKLKSKPCVIRTKASQR